MGQSCSKGAPAAGAVSTSQTMKLYETEQDDTPISGQLFADIIISLMVKSPQGPSEGEGKLLILMTNQGTSPDKKGKLGRTPRMYASQHRLPVWLRFIIHRLEVDPPGDTPTERHRGSFDVDGCYLAELPFGSSERAILQDVLKSNSDPQSARFHRNHYREKTDSKDKVEALKKGYGKLDSLPFADDMPEEDAVRMGLWMVGQISAELAIKAFTGTLLFDVYQVGMGIADIWMRWSGRKKAKLAWRGFAIAYRQVFDSALTLERLTEDSNVSTLSTTDAKKSLEAWIEAIKGLVMRMHEEIKRAIEGHRAQQSDLLNLMYRSNAELVVKDAEINKEISQLQQKLETAEEMITIKTTLKELQAKTERRLKLDPELEGSLKILFDDIGSNNGSTATLDQKEKASKDVFDKLVIIRDEETGNTQLVDIIQVFRVSGPGPSRASTAGGVEETKGQGGAG